MIEVLDARQVGSQVVLRERIREDNTVWGLVLTSQYMVRVIRPNYPAVKELIALRYTTSDEASSIDRFHNIIRSLERGSSPSTKLKDSQKICVLCKKPMKLRQGKYGSFYGCSAYPKCNSVVNMNGKINASTMKKLKKKTLEEKPKEVKLLDSRFNDIDLE